MHRPVRYALVASLGFVFPAARAVVRAATPVIEERAVYDVRIGPIHVGTGTLTVACDSSSAQPARRIRIAIRGGPPFFRVDNSIESLSDPATGGSLRFSHSVKEGRHVDNNSFTFDHVRSVSIDQHGVERATPEHPVDDAGFLLVVRNLPMHVGTQHQSRRYFRQAANPISADIITRDTIEVPAGSFDAYMVRPFISGSTLFGERGRAELWIANDSSRAIVQLTAKAKLGTMTMRLRSFERGAPGC